jgi:hypothetical protein
MYLRHTNHPLEWLKKWPNCQISSAINLGATPSKFIIFVDPSLKEWVILVITKFNRLAPKLGLWESTTNSSTVRLFGYHRAIYSDDIQYASMFDRSLVNWFIIFHSLRLSFFNFNWSRMQTRSIFRNLYATVTKAAQGQPNFAYLGSYRSCLLSSGSGRLNCLCA